MRHANRAIGVVNERRSQRPSILAVKYLKLLGYNRRPLRGALGRANPSARGEEIPK